jgi:hypothetical protein
MKRSVIINTSGILILIIWLFTLFLLVKREHDTSPPVNTHNVYSQSNFEEESEHWMDIFLKENKVGYAVTKIKKISSGFEVNEKILLFIDLMGSRKKIMSNTSAQVDKEFLLNEFEYFIVADSMDFMVSGKIKDKNLHLSIGKGKDTETRLITLPSKPMIASGLSCSLGSLDLRVNNSYALNVFDPLTMTTNTCTIKVTKREIVKIADISHDAFRLEMTYLGSPLVLWVDKKGTPLKETGFMGFSLVKSSPEKAKAHLDHVEKIDLYDLSAINVEHKIQGPRDVSYVKLQFDSAPLIPIPEGFRQKFHNNILEIYKEQTPLSSSYTIPYNGNDSELLHYLEPEIFIQSNDSDIKMLSQKIVKNAIHPEIAARMIMEWVFENIEKTPIVSIPDAKKTLISRKGDCNEHAALMTALLRAAGIPSRIATGLAYNNERFYYHAWNEAYTNGWITMDAVFKQMPVDATHIKLITGGIEKQALIAGTVNSLKFKVLDYR